MKHHLLVAAALCAVLAASHASTTTEGAPDLALEELLNIDVQTASRKAQRLQDVAAAVQVITREDIERSGAASLPDLLRMVPGMQVAQLASDRWAVTARGFNGRFANKLQVLMDGRSLYSPLFSGVMWEAEGTLLEDIERIEVIRGPNAALWGANAVNGVINIITRHARDTRGTLVVAEAGDPGQGSLAARHGFGWADGSVRVWLKAQQQQPGRTAAGERLPDGSSALRSGMRGDWAFGDSSRLTVSGMVYDTRATDRWNDPDLLSPLGYEPVDAEQANRGGHLMARHEWLSADGSETAVQAYVERGLVSGIRGFRHQRTTVDLDFQHRTLVGTRHDVVWGAGYRSYNDHADTSASTVTLLPARRHWRLASLFVNDEITLLPGTLKATLGARLEHHDQTGFEPQPTARLAWTPNAEQTLWAAVSAASRTPSRGELDIELDFAVLPAQGGMPPVLVHSEPLADRELQAERVRSLELGWRQRLAGGVSLDAALFQADYHDLRTARIVGVQLQTSPIVHLRQDGIATTSGRARVRGLELALDGRVGSAMRWELAYTHLRMSTRPETSDPAEVGSLLDFEGSLPRHQLSLRGGWALPASTRLDAWLRHVSRLPGTPMTPSVDPYTTLDLRLGWRLGQGVDLALIGRNLLAGPRIEFRPDSLPSQAQFVERSLLARVKWQF